MMMLKYLQDNILSYFIWAIFISVLNIRFLKMNEDGTFQFFRVLFVEHKNSFKLVSDFMVHLLGFTLMRLASFYIKTH